MHQAYDTDGESHSQEKSADITSDTLSHIVQNASPEEKAQLEQLQNTLEGGQSHAHGKAHTSSESVAADILSHVSGLSATPLYPTEQIIRPQLASAPYMAVFTRFEPTICLAITFASSFV